MIKLAMVLTIVFAAGCGARAADRFTNSDGGGDGALASCGQVEPCAGSLLGTWDLAGGCANQTALMTSADSTGCPTAGITVTGFSVSGSISFNADMTYSAADATGSFGYLEDVPYACLNGHSCDQVSAAIAAQLQASPQPGLTLTSCAVAGNDDCLCTFEVAVFSPGQAGTYTVSGSSLTTTSATGAVATIGTCVQGAQLHLVSLDSTMSTGPMGAATISADVVANQR
jgi:hypothetical protein